MLEQTLRGGRRTPGQAVAESSTGMVPKEPAGRGAQQPTPAASRAHALPTTSHRAGQRGTTPGGQPPFLPSRWLKKKHKHVSPAAAQPPVGVEGSRGLPAVGPAAKLPKAGACRGLSSLSGSTCRRGRPGPTAKRLGPGST